MSSLSDLVNQVIAEHGDGIDIEFEWHPLPPPSAYQPNYSDKFLYIPPSPNPMIKRIKVRWVKDAL